MKFKMLVRMNERGMKRYYTNEMQKYKSAKIQKNAKEKEYKNEMQ